jgi:hypothetical protein
LTKAQKKNLARKNKRADEKNARNWDSDEDEEGQSKQPGASSVASGAEANKDGAASENEAKPAEVKPQKAPKSALGAIQSTLQSLRLADPHIAESPSTTALPSSTAPAPSAEAATAPAIESSISKPSIRPGGGVLRDLPIKSRDQPTPASKESLPSQPPEAQPAPTSERSAPSQPSRRIRQEVKVRPGGGLQGLQGLVKQIAAEQGQPAKRR